MAANQHPDDDARGAVIRSLGEVFKTHGKPEAILLERHKLQLTLRFPDAMALAAFYDLVVALDG